MYLEQIRSFCMVVDHGSYTLAGRQLALTQPAVSQHVRSLEHEFAIPLIQRIGGRMRPTEAGEVVYRLGVEIMARADAIRDRIDIIKGVRGGRVVIGAGIGPGNYVLPQLVARFRRRYPDAQVELCVDDVQAVFQLVTQGLVDFAVVLGHEVPRGIFAVPLYRDPVVLVVAPGHPVVRRWPKVLPMSALASLPLVARSERVSVTRRLCGQWMRQAGLEPLIEMEFENPEAIKRVVANGIGAAFLYLSSVALEIAAGRLKLVEVEGFPLLGQFVLAGRTRQHLSPTAKAFLTTTVAGLQEEGLVPELNYRAAEQFLNRDNSVG